MNEDPSGRLRAFSDGELDDAERRAVEQELATSPEMRAALAELRALDAELDDLFALDVREPDVAPAWSALRRRLHPPVARRRSTMILVASSALALAVVLVLWSWLGARPTTGSLTADARRTVAIGTRATAVAETGSALAWDVDANGDTRVRQTAGAVFYRVDAGGAFVVETPSGRVTVTGTCFTVELDPMDTKLKHLASTAAGAALASGLFLTVREGHVLLADDRGDVEVAAGESAWAQTHRAPVLDDDALAATSTSGPSGSESSSHASAPAFAALVRENSIQRAELRRLQAELATRRATDAGGAAAAIDRESLESRRAAAQECAESGGCDMKLWTDPSPEELVELAKCGRLLVDTPPFVNGGELFPGGSIIEAAGLSEAESNRFAEIAGAFQAETGRTLKEFAIELGVPVELTDRLSVTQLQGLVDAVVDDDVHEATRRRIADERAGIGQVPPVAEQGAGERALRFQYRLGEAFEQRLATEFGSEAAHEMRRADGGWLTKSSMGDGECSR